MLLFHELPLTIGKENDVDLNYINSSTSYGALHTFSFYTLKFEIAIENTGTLNF